MTELRYPAAGRLDLTEDILGFQVSDPYRWLEDAASDERAGWLAAQAELFGSYREELPGRDRLAAQVRDLLGTGHVGTPAWRGDRYFFTRRDPGAEHGALYLQAGDGPKPGGVLIDPMAIDPSGRTTLDAWQPDKEGRLLAYQLSAGRRRGVAAACDGCRHRRGSSTGRSTGAGTPTSPGCPAARPSTTRAGCPPDAVPAGESQYHRRVYLHQVGTPAGRGHADLRRGPGQDELLRRLGQPGRPVAVHQRLGGAPRRATTCGSPTCPSPIPPRPTCG